MTVLGSIAFASGCYLGVVALEQQFFTSCHDFGVSLLLPALWSWWQLLVALGAVAALVAFCFQASSRATLAFSLIPLFAFLYVFVRSPTPSGDDLVRVADERPGGQVGFVGEVISAPTAGKLIIEPLVMEFPVRRKLDGKTAVIVYGGNSSPPAVPGCLVRVRGRVRRDSTRTYSWEPNFAVKSMRDGVFSVCFARSVGYVPGGYGAGIRAVLCAHTGTVFHESWLCIEAFRKKWTSYWVAARRFIVESHCRVLGDSKGRLLSSIVIGDRAVELDKSVRDQFRAVGLSHLLAASGFNLSILVGCVYFLCRSIVKSRYINCGFGCLATLFFVCLAGSSPSVVRAAIMCLLLLAARAFFASVCVLATLASTLILALLVDPLSIADVGLQMSYAATASIICGARPLGEYFRLPLWKNIRNLSDGCADLAAVIILAQSGVLPLQLSCFWVLGLLFLPANLLVDPIIAPITICGFISSALCLMRFTFGLDAISLVDLEKWLDWFVSSLLDYMLFLSGKLAEMPLASISVGPPTSFSIVGYYLALAFFISMLRSKHTVVLGLSVFVWGLFMLLWRAPVEDFIALDGDAMLSPSLGFVRGTGRESWHLERIAKFSGLNDSRVSGPGNIAVRDRVFAVSELAAKGDFVFLESGSLCLLACKNGVEIGPIESESTSTLLSLLRPEDQRKELLVWIRDGTTFFQTVKGVAIASSSKKGKPIVLALRKRKAGGSLPEPLYQLFSPFKRFERSRGSPFIELR